MNDARVSSYRLEGLDDSTSPASGSSQERGHLFIPIPIGGGPVGARRVRTAQRCPNDLYVVNADRQLSMPHPIWREPQPIQLVEQSPPGCDRKSFFSSRLDGLGQDCTRRGGERRRKKAGAGECRKREGIIKARGPPAKLAPDPLSARAPHHLAPPGGGAAVGRPQGPGSIRKVRKKNNSSGYLMGRDLVIMGRPDG